MEEGTLGQVSCYSPGVPGRDKSMVKVFCSCPAGSPVLSCGKPVLVQTSRPISDAFHRAVTSRRLVEPPLTQSLGNDSKWPRLVRGCWLLSLEQIRFLALRDPEGTGLSSPI